MSQFCAILVNKDGEVTQDNLVCPYLLAAKLVSVEVNILEECVLHQCCAYLFQVLRLEIVGLQLEMGQLMWTALEILHQELEKLLVAR